MKLDIIKHGIIAIKTTRIFNPRYVNPNEGTLNGVRMCVTNEYIFVVYIGKQLGITDFINPRDSDKPVHEVSIYLFSGYPHNTVNFFKPYLCLFLCFNYHVITETFNLH